MTRIAVTVRYVGEDVPGARYAVVHGTKDLAWATTRAGIPVLREAIAADTAWYAYAWREQGSSIWVGTTRSLSTTLAGLQDAKPWTDFVALQAPDETTASELARALRQGLKRERPLPANHAALLCSLGILADGTKPDPQQPVPQWGGGLLFLAHPRGADARARLQEGASFTVLAGSRANATEVKSLEAGARRRRVALQEQGILVAGDTGLVFTADAEFSSPSTAATIVLGANTNGWDCWRDGAGTPLGALVGRVSPARPRARKPRHR